MQRDNTDNLSASRLPATNKTQNDSPNKSSVNLPVLELPKGGGALKGIEEKF